MKRLLHPQKLNKPTTFLCIGNYATDLFRQYKYIWLLIFLSIVFTDANYAQTIPPGVAPVYPPAGGFDMDGDLYADTITSTHGDWLDGTGSGGFVLNIDGSEINSATTFHLIDPYANGTGNQFTAACAKHDCSPADWTWAVDEPSGKTDINNACIHLTTDTVTGDAWLIVSADRETTNGESWIEFQLLQATVTDNPDYTFSTAGLQGGRTLDDIAIQVGFSQQNDPLFAMARWSPDNKPNTYIWLCRWKYYYCASTIWRFRKHYIYCKTAY